MSIQVSGIYTGEQAEPAADALRDGYVVDWQPGDGTRYECALLYEQADAQDPGRAFRKGRAVLHLRNFGCAVPLDRQIDSIHWTVRPTIPAGSWQGMRPLLAALGYAEGPAAMRDYDRSREADLRTSGYDREPPNHRDAVLGRKVRRLMESDAGGTPPPLVVST